MAPWEEVVALWQELVLTATPSSLLACQKRSILVQKNNFPGISMYFFFYIWEKQAKYMHTLPSH